MNRAGRIAALLTACRKRAVLAGAVLLIGGAAAQASEATQLADRAGFFVGHAHRCGIGLHRLERTKAVIDRLISAYALDGGDEDAAQEQFAERALASALAKELGEPLPSCSAVRTRLAQFERHRPASPEKAKDEKKVATRKQTGAHPGHAAATANAPKAATPPATEIEDPAPEQRAALEPKRAAQQTRVHARSN